MFLQWNICQGLLSQPFNAALKTLLKFCSRCTGTPQCQFYTLSFRAQCVLLEVLAVTNRRSLSCFLETQVLSWNRNLLTKPVLWYYKKNPLRFYNGKLYTAVLYVNVCHRKHPESKRIMEISQSSYFYPYLCSVKVLLEIRLVWKVCFNQHLFSFYVDIQ